MWAYDSYRSSANNVKHENLQIWNCYLKDQIQWTKITTTMTIMIMIIVILILILLWIIITIIIIIIIIVIKIIIVDHKPISILGTTAMDEQAQPKNIITTAALIHFFKRKGA